VLTNRLSDPQYRRMWGSTLGDQAFNAGGGEFKGREYDNGQRIYKDALGGSADTGDCRDVYWAVAACNAGPVSRIAPLFGPLLAWKGVLQGSVQPYRMGDVRVNNTEFSPRHE
jgi:hypothetical protein